MPSENPSTLGYGADEPRNTRGARGDSGNGCRCGNRLLPGLGSPVSVLTAQGNVANSVGKLRSSTSPQWNNESSSAQRSGS